MSYRPSADDALDDVLGALADAHRSWAPIVANDRLAGIISARDVVSAYRRALAAKVRQVRAVGSTGALVEADVGPTSVLAGSSVAEAAWPRDTVLVSIGRGDRVIVPRGDVRLEAGDRLTVFSAPGARGREVVERRIEVRLARGGRLLPVTSRVPIHRARDPHGVHELDPRLVQTALQASEEPDARPEVD